MQFVRRSPAFTRAHAGQGQRARGPGAAPGAVPRAPTPPTTASPPRRSWTGCASRRRPATWRWRCSPGRSSPTRREFGAGELVAMFHTYFMGSAEGLLFDVPDDDYDTALWAPLGRHLAGLGVDVTWARQHRRGDRRRTGRTAVVIDGEASDRRRRRPRHRPAHRRELIADLAGSSWGGVAATRRGHGQRAAVRGGPAVAGRPGGRRPPGVRRHLRLRAAGQRLGAGALREGRRATGRRSTGGSVVELHAYAVRPGGGVRPGRG